MNKVFLIGFMGSGKSTVGKALARQLGLAFCDLDTLVEQYTGQSIEQVFAQQGEEAFRRAEQACLHSLESKNNLVIACGGGSPCFYDNMDWMNKQGLTIYLQLDAAALAERLRKKASTRPLLKGLEPEGLLPFIRQKLAEREHFYLQARWSIKGLSLDVKKLAEKIRKLQ